ncbi:MAG: ABC transporter permease [Cohaesibacter sp.]|nr:ABC transporter permease [Cohaesibacter sp.]MCV6600841.1 ABC transporter permease [Cohaesibacter sp.]
MSGKARSGLILSAGLDLKEAMRSRWFHIYSLVFTGLMVLLISMGITESRVLGFTGLSRLLVTFIQLTMAILPLFVLVTTVRSLVGDREAGTLEYLLSFPIKLSDWYWGKLLGRLFVVVVPIGIALVIAASFSLIKGHALPYLEIAYYSGLVVSLALCFLGFAFFLSSIAKSTEFALGLSLLIWLLLVAFLDLILIGVLIRENFDPNFVLAIALANPLQTFRTAAMILFDPQLVLLGPAAFLILDNFGSQGYVFWALAYPSGLGLVFAALGFWRMRSGDLV